MPDGPGSGTATFSTALNSGATGNPVYTVRAAIFGIHNAQDTGARIGCGCVGWTVRGGPSGSLGDAAADDGVPRAPVNG